MTPTDLDRALAGALADRRLLDHPFYRRWQRGEVSIAELGAYGAQYRHFEAGLPAFLSALVEELPEGTARRLVAANLADELGDPVPHLELFGAFATAVAATDAPASPATVGLLETYEELLADGPAAALAGFAAYECQAPEVARSKAEGLRRHYGLGDDGVAFWDLHAEVDARHGAWATEALSSTADDVTVVARAARRAADAWWAFLDEREATAELAAV